MKKRLWMTSLLASKTEVEPLMRQIRTYGLTVDGHFWTNDLDNMAWLGPREPLIDPRTGMWVILTDRASIDNPEIRYGLSLLSLTVQTQKGIHFPVVILQTDAPLVEPTGLPTPLRGAEILSAASAAFGPKLVAMLHKPETPLTADYRMDVYAMKGIGQWLEMGPREGVWKGAIMGVSGGEIVLHAVGPRDKLPEKTVLNYPQEGLQLSIGETNYTAWAVQNELDADHSYYAKVEGCPDSLVFGAYPETDDAEMFVIELK